MFIPTSSPTIKGTLSNHRPANTFSPIANNTTSTPPLPLHSSANCQVLIPGVATYRTILQLLTRTLYQQPCLVRELLQISNLCERTWSLIFMIYIIIWTINLTAPSNDIKSKNHFSAFCFVTPPIKWPLGGIGQNCVGQGYGHYVTCVPLTQQLTPFPFIQNNIFCWRFLVVSFHRIASL